MEPLPVWARPLGTWGRARELLKHVTRVVTYRYAAPVVDETSGTLSVPDGPVFGMGTIAHVAAREPRSRWKLLTYDIIASYDQVGPGKGRALLTDWDRVRERLRVRIFGDAYADAEFPLVSEPLGPRSSVGLAVALDGVMVAVAEEHSHSWGVSLDEAWDVARRNVLERVPVRHKMMASEGCVFALVQGETLAVTGHALDLSVALKDRDPHGGPTIAVIAPSAHCLVVSPLVFEDTDRQLRSCRRAASILASTEPNPVSLDVFRYRGPGRLSYEPSWSAPEISAA